MNWLILLLGAAIAVVVLISLARAFFFLVQVNGMSMMPDLEDGERVLTLRHWPPGWWRKGQVVVWELPQHSISMPVFHMSNNALYIKRILGLPGDVVILPPPELPGVSGQAVSRRDGQNPQIWEIPPGYCFVKGDSPGLDSTILGPIPFQCVRGVVITKLPLRSYRLSRIHGPSGVSRHVDKSGEM
jgi:signal peptidase I